jgi:hypothetical protein
MASHPPDKQTQSSGRYLYVLGLAAMGIGLLLILSFPDAALRSTGAVIMLFGTVLTGSYFIGRLKAEVSSGNFAPEPTWNKPAHGAAGYGRLPATDGPAPTHGAGLPRPSPQAEAAKLPSPVKEPERTSPSVLPASAPPGLWAAPVFDQMSARQFGAMCEALLAQGGFETRSQSHGPSGGVAVWLHSRNSRGGGDSPVSVALCGQWRNQPVDAPRLRPLLALMATHQLARGTCATSSGFTEDARQFAKLKGINLLDRAALLALIARRTPDQQRALLALARGSD